jgi:catechol 2,3-dioxygenase-like lactoylglutathione lyase family enzyme
MLSGHAMKKDVFTILYARDLPRLIEFYRDLLGMTLDREILQLRVGEQASGTRPQNTNNT